MIESHMETRSVSKKGKEAEERGNCLDIESQQRGGR